MRRQILRVLAVLAPTLLAAPAAATDPVDDFEVGPFSFQITGAYQENDVFIETPGHVYSSPRTVILEPQTENDYISVELTQTYGDDSAQVQFDGDGRVRFQYEWGFPRDLTANGTYDRVDVTFSNVSPGSYFALGIGDAGSGCGDDRFPAGTWGTVSWDLDDWCNGLVDETAAEWIALYLYPGDPDATFEVRDIRFHRANGAFIPDITGNFVATQWPPLPSSPLAWTAALVGQPLYRTDLRAQAVASQGVTPGMSAGFQVLGNPDAEWGLVTFDWDDQMPFDETDMTISIDFSPADGWMPEIIYPPDPVYGQGGFSLNTGVELRDGGGIVHGSSLISLAFTEGIQQELLFENVEVSLTSGKQGLGTGLEISFTLLPVNVDDIFTLFEMSFDCDWREAQSTGIAPTRPEAPGELTLVAEPSVTRGETVIRASRPMKKSATIAIFDASGRRVRLLELPAATTSVGWDGRDASGAPAASGAYFARVDGAAARGSARITRLR